MELGYRLLELAKTMFPHTFEILPPVSEGGKPFISLLAGNRGMESSNWSAHGMLQMQDSDCAAFRAMAEQYRLY